MTQPPTTPGYQSIPPQGASGLATAALVVGIVGVCFALVLGCIPFFGSGLGGLFGIVAIVLGAIAMSQGGPASLGRARAGLILGIIALLVAITWHFVIRAGLRKAGSVLNEKASQLQQQMDAAQKKIEEEQKKAEERAKQQKPSSEPGTLGPSSLPWRLASRVGNLPEQTVYLVMPSKA